MLSKAVFAFAVLSVLVPMLAANPLQIKGSEDITIIELEEACVRQGGMCVRISDCLPDNLVKTRGVLCPMQSHLGVECCYY